MENFKNEFNEIDAVNYKYKAVSEEINKLKSLAIIEINNPIYSHRKVYGKLIVWFKRIIRKIIFCTLNWYIEPIIQNQINFNLAMADVTNNLKEAAEFTSKNLEEEVEELSKKLKQFIKEEQEARRLLSENIKSVNIESHNMSDAVESKVIEFIKEEQELKDRLSEFIKEEQEAHRLLSENIEGINIENYNMNNALESKVIEFIKEEQELKDRLSEFIKEEQEARRLLSENIESVNMQSHNMNNYLESKVIEFIKEEQEARRLLSENIESVNMQSHNMNNSLESKIIEFIKEEQEARRLLSGNIESVNIESHNMNNDVRKNLDYINNRINLKCNIDLLNRKIDYFDFENRFRGSRENIINKQRQYVEYFRNNKSGKVLDIGCGRGEFLEVMFEANLDAYGVDVYEPFVDYCKNRGFNVIKQDALTHLNSLEDSSLSGIFMDSVIEHVETDYLLALIGMAYRKLKTGCYFIIISPNPENFGGLNNFNIDLEHKTPIHYLTLEYLLKRENFQEVVRYESPEAEFPARVFEIDGVEFANKEEFNNGMKAVNKYVFGNREYVAIAKK